MTRDCQCPQARHEHGTQLAYIRDRCRCEPCREANTIRERTRNRAKLYGRYDGLVDAEPVREHIRLLSASGVGLKRIAVLTGMGGGVLTKLVYGQPREDGTRRPPSARCTPRVRDRILAVQPDDLAPCALVDSAGTHRRLQALVVNGWSQCQLAARLGMARSNFGTTMKAARVRRSTADAVRALYEQLWDTAAPEDTHRERIAASRARRYAHEAGWVPPLAWDEDNIDTPVVLIERHLGPREVDEIAVTEAMAGRRVQLTRAELAEARRRLDAQGLSARVIAERLGTTARTVTRYRRAAA